MPEAEPGDAVARPETGDARTDGDLPGDLAAERDRLARLGDFPYDRDFKDLVGIFNDLQSAGLVVREPDPKDRRKNAVSLTEDGARLLERCETAARRANDTLLAPLSAAERDQFMGLSTRISGTEPPAG
ncbi:MarR family winged helix-turn-helix transcriptional regulator [Streptomyces sp. NBC_00996]|uniref:MarR family winged helix-turn-helix transcriptional regulator n=1 Tax=Streptomyces sp. NBC_00996 TaxID=2903710 RepID=UPI00386C33A9|nr:winged helix DNA-binding protein [Streptomyces sp. NBC_00996]